MDKNWIILEPGNSQDVEHLTNALSVEKPIANLLVQRGIKTYEDAKSFFRPDLSDLHDPFLMKDMEVAVNRLDKALENKETILVYGDYDVDGTTSVAMMYTFLKERSEKVSFYIPDRYNEGYGISLKGIDFAASQGVSLVVALDCGIKAVEKIEYATKLGVDFIICDHHTAGAKIPQAVAVLDPKRSDCSYPFKELSGCGVGYKLLEAYCIRKNISREALLPLLDLVVVSIASDIVPIIGENRVLAYCGLKQLNTSPRSGLHAIIKLAGLENKNITIDDIVFKIGPRINAAGRIETGNSSVELLISDNEAASLGMGDQINDFNNTRRNIDTNITKEALDFIAGCKDMVDKKATVVFNSNWHKGVVGIVASRLTETYYRPTIVLTESNGLITGSARSVIGFDLYKAVEACSHLLENFGGHMYAAGLTLKKENLKAFKQKFEEVVADTIMAEQLVPSIEIDMELSLRDINPKLYRILKQFEPFGPGNMAPVFISENVVDDGTGKQVGGAKEHLKLNILHEDEPFKPYPAIGFNLGSHFKSIGKGRPFDVCYCIDENEYRGQTTIQLRIKDIKPIK
jgi:single-stranded-DNA-specific exonuclease